MDMLIDIHDEKYLFFGEVPDSMHDTYRKFGLAKGVGY
jgi:hypothetical protein